MISTEEPTLDLNPPRFEEGLFDWSTGDGTPDTLTYAQSKTGRVVRRDPEFDTCLELRTTSTIQRLRYMGELPILPGAYIEVKVRLRAIHGAPHLARIAAWPGDGWGGCVSELPKNCAPVAFEGQGRIMSLKGVIGPEARPGVDLVWDHRARYAHLGLDIIGCEGALLRVEDFRVHEVTETITGAPRVAPGFTASDYPAETPIHQDAAG